MGLRTGFSWGISKKHIRFGNKFDRVEGVRCLNFYSTCCWVEWTLEGFSGTSEIMYSMGRTSRSSTNKTPPVRRLISFFPTCSLLLPWQASRTTGLNIYIENWQFRPQSHKNEISEISPRQKSVIQIETSNSRISFTVDGERRSSRKVMWVSNEATILQQAPKDRSCIHAAGVLQMHACKSFKVSTFATWKFGSLSINVRYQEIRLMNKLLLVFNFIFKFSC